MVSWSHGAHSTAAKVSSIIPTSDSKVLRSPAIETKKQPVTLRFTQNLGFDRLWRSSCHTDSAIDDTHWL